LARYNDSPDEDWIISRIPGDDSLVLATAGSGHAYKFLPVIGRLVADLIQNKMEPNIVNKFAVNRRTQAINNSRGSSSLKELNFGDICLPEDLLKTNIA